MSQSLTDRLRDVLSATQAGRAGQAGEAGRPRQAGRTWEVGEDFRPAHPAGLAVPAHPAPPAHPALEALGGSWRDEPSGRCYVVERRFTAETRYGRQTLGQIAGRIEAASREIRLLAGGESACCPFVFFDLETTGLSGGAGTHVFLVGCAWLNGAELITRQYLLTRFADEPSLLSAVAADLSQAGSLVSFNGKSFDAPVLETRYLFHRLTWSVGAVPHVDVLHPARRFWKDGDTESGTLACSLGALERRVLGVGRVGDVPGIEIPSRYFHFLRSGDARPLAAVLEHNRLDLISLAGLTARLLHLIQAGSGVVSDGREALAIGIVYSRAGLHDQACEAYERAVALSTDRSVLRCDALRSLAAALRRRRRFDEAATRWRQLSTTAGCPPAYLREAHEALAVHHEHRARDLVLARAFAVQTLKGDAGAAWRRAGERRLSRIDRKLQQAVMPGLQLG